MTKIMFCPLLRYSERLFAPISVVILILFAFIFGDVAPRQNKYSNLLSSIVIYFLYSNLVIVVNQLKKNPIYYFRRVMVGMLQQQFYAIHYM